MVANTRAGWTDCTAPVLPLHGGGDPAIQAVHGGAVSGTVVIVRYRALPGHVGAAKRAITALVATVEASEPDCGGITVLQDSNDPTGFTLIERWPSHEIFLGPHMQQPHIRSFIQAAADFLVGPPDISFWRPVGAKREPPRDPGWPEQ